MLKKPSKNFRPKCMHTALRDPALLGLKWTMRSFHANNFFMVLYDHVQHLVFTACHSLLPSTLLSPLPASRFLSTETSSKTAQRRCRWRKGSHTIIEFIWRGEKCATWWWCVSHFINSNSGLIIGIIMWLYDFFLPLWVHYWNWKLFFRFCGFDGRKMHENRKAQWLVNG